MATISAPSGLPPTQQATAMSGAVDFSAQSRELSADAHSQDFDLTVQQGDVDLTAKKAPLQYRLGFQSSSGRNVDYTSQLSEASQDKLMQILEAYSPGNTNFSIDLTHLVDGHGYPLRPVSGRDLRADLQTLRDIAQEANGPSKIKWNTYPEGWRAVAGHKPAFALGHSERLYDLQFENEDLERRIESLRTVGTPPNGKTQGEMETEALAKTQVALARYHASLASMKFIKNALRHQITHLEKQREPDTGARIHKLQRLLDQLPDAELPENEKEQKTMHDNGQLTKRWTVLFGATHMPHPGEQADLHQLEQDVTTAVNKVPMKAKDGEGFLNRLPVQWFRNLSESNQETENRFIKSVVLLGAKDRATYEAWRRDRKAEETSDGAELFNVQLANVMATGKSVEEVEDFMHDASLQIALSGLDEKDIPDCTRFIQERAGKWHAELQRVSEEFRQTPGWKDMTASQLCTTFQQLIHTPT